MADTDKPKDEKSSDTEELTRKSKSRSKPKPKPPPISQGIYPGDLPPRRRLKRKT